MSKTLDIFLRKVEKNLKHLNEAERTDILHELNTYIVDLKSDKALNDHEILEKLGSPKKIALEYMSQNISQRSYSYGRDLMMIALGVIIIVLATLVNSEIVQPMFNSESNLLFDLYTAMSQLLPIALAPSVGNYFTRDYEDSSINFYKNAGVPLKKYYLSRFFVLTIGGSIIVLLVSQLFLFFQSALSVYGISVSIVVVLQYIYVILLTALVAFITKSRIITIVGIILGTLLLSLLNILPIPIVKGHLFLLDAHSKVTANMKIFLFESDLQKYFTTILVLVVWNIVLFTIYYTIISKKNKQ